MRQIEDETLRMWKHYRNRRVPKKWVCGDRDWIEFTEEWQPGRFAENYPSIELAGKRNCTCKRKSGIPRVFSPRGIYQYQHNFVAI